MPLIGDLGGTVPILIGLNPDYPSGREMMARQLRGSSA